MFKKKTAFVYNPDEIINVSNEMKLKNVLMMSERITSMLCCENELHSIFSFIKILTDKMFIGNTSQLIYTGKDSFESSTSRKLFYIDTVMMPITYLSSLGITYNQLLINDEIKIEISLADCPILTTTWQRERLERCLCNIGTTENPWDENSKNPNLHVFLPMGVSFVNRGNHSIFSGMIKGQGVLTESNCAIYNLAPLYNIMYFDGTYYVNTKTGERICEAMSFEFGCIFEIGRQILDRNIRFKGI